ncbi:MAG: hypothetical protein HY361_05640 [Candidatus Aenigmarchaeota archaeon]|nr:hypothetical protein [Candidatus Aenigmarchaeota archaeon]
MVKLETLHAEIEEIKSNVNKILVILENEGEVREEVLGDLEEARHAPKGKYISHEDAKKRMK